MGGKRSTTLFKGSRAPLEGKRLDKGKFYYRHTEIWITPLKQPIRLTATLKSILSCFTPHPEQKKPTGKTCQIDSYM
ncbi:hypothetical protein AV530_017454 [Patagioenas fasciata monilis]|uniref:Uncharacterized protein n=1 Tax=Patagioenas fasciata monilis TaxID=372326 RepID=A0A1V4JGK6_PATFA|nr:hypothetical protein AV530_017454 [Patagioenas fasciata monilis]